MAIFTKLKINISWAFNLSSIQIKSRILNSHLEPFKGLEFKTTIFDGSMDIGILKIGFKIFFWKNKVGFRLKSLWNLIRCRREFNLWKKVMSSWYPNIKISKEDLQHWNFGLGLCNIWWISDCFKMRPLWNSYFYARY